MRNSYLLFFFIFLFSCTTSQTATTIDPTIITDPISERMADHKKHTGFFDYWWDEKAGKVWLEIKELDKEFLYVNSLQAGVGSNDIGLDRGQLGQERIVKFIRVGPKVLLIQPNYRFRAESDNDKERKSVEEAFAQSVLGGFKIEAETGNRILVDASHFLMRDACLLYTSPSPRDS